MALQVVDLNDEHMHLISTCTHVDDTSEEVYEAARRRQAWLEETMTKGLRVKVALDGGRPVGFAHCLPANLGLGLVSGTDLMTIPCLTLRYEGVYREERGSGYGRALVEAVEEEAKKDLSGVALLAYDTGFWFMPAAFFAHLGYEEVDRRGEAVIMLKAFRPVDPPVIRVQKYQPHLVPGRVTVDAFWNPLCSTSLVEMARIREVCAEYGDQVLLSEYDCGKPDIVARYGMERAIFVEGERKDWGYEAPREGLRKEINLALSSLARE